MNNWNRHLETHKNEILFKCTRCGNCISDCSIRNHRVGSDIPPEEFLDSVLDCLQSDNSGKDMLNWALQCMGCGHCDMVCPEGLRPSVISQLIILPMIQAGQYVPMAKSFMCPEERYYAFELIRSIMMRPDEVRWLTSIPENPAQSDVVVFLGCGINMMPDKAFVTIDVLERMGIDFVAVGGGTGYCCSVSMAFMGELDRGDHDAKKLVQDLSAFNPKTIVFLCPTCDHICQDVFGDRFSQGIKVQHITEFLADNIERILFTNTIAKKVTYHDPCHLGRGRGVYDAPRKVIQAIPGVELVEMSHNRENSLCCGGAAGLGSTSGEGPSQIRRQRVMEVEECQADVMVNACIGCQGAFARREATHPFQVIHIMDLVGEAMGIRYQDRYKEYLCVGNSNELLAKTEGNIEASKYSMEEMRNIVPLFFQMLS